MDSETLHRANELSKMIASCEFILKHAEKFEYVYRASPCSETKISEELPDDLKPGIKELVKRKMEECKKEFENL